MQTHQRAIIFDFDGTVCLGLGPVLSYARHVARSLEPLTADRFMAQVDAALSTTGEVDGVRPIDGYDAVRLLSLQHGVQAPTRDAAYLASRRELATDAAPVCAPDGLADFLAEIRPAARLLLATNAPPIRIDEALEALGLTGCFDAVHTSVGKPSGFGTLLDGLLSARPQDPADADRALDARALLSIGDVWDNDLAPVSARGGTTVLVGESARHLPGTGSAAAATATPDFAAPALPGLYPGIRRWLDTPTAN